MGEHKRKEKTWQTTLKDAAGILPMDKDRFQKLATAFPVSYRVEKEWFKTEDEHVIGAVVFDRVDSDWSFVALSRHLGGKPDLLFAVFDHGVSFKTQDEARDALHTAMHSGGKEESATRKETKEIAAKFPGGIDKAIDAMVEGSEAFARQHGWKE